MFENEPIAIKAKKEMAEILLSEFVEKNSELIATVIATDRENIGKSEVVETLIKAPMKVGDYSFQDAEIEFGKVSILRKIYFRLLEMSGKISYEDFPCKETLCGVALVITFRIIVFK